MLMAGNDPGLLARLNRLDPTHWSVPVLGSVVFAFFLGAVFIDGLARREWGAYFPSLFLLPVAMAIIDRAHGRRYRDIATWVVPWLAAALLAPVFLDGALLLVVLLALTATAVAMVLSEKVHHAWSTLVAPGHYQTLPQPDRRISSELDNLAGEIWKAQARLAKTHDLEAFRRKSGVARRKALALTIDEPEWRHLRSLWLTYLDRWDELAGVPIDDDAWADLDARRDAYLRERDRLRAERSRPIGTRRR